MKRTLKNEQVAVAAGSSDVSILGEVAADGTVTAASYIPDAAITGANTNTRQLRLVNRGQAGAGVAVVASLQFDAGVNGVAGDEKALTLSGTPANLQVKAGDVIAMESNAVGTGIADPGGLFQLEIEDNFA
jgi:hypothetical protein